MLGKLERFIIIQCKFKTSDICCKSLKIFLDITDMHRLIIFSDIIEMHRLNLGFIYDEKHGKSLVCENGVTVLLDILVE